LGGVLAALNYDPLFEQASNRQLLTWKNRANTPDSVVLGLSSYAKVKDDSQNQAVLVFPWE
jgi:hypothetical protein